MRELEPGFEIEEKDDFGTVYGDIVTFIAVLFVLLFTMSYNDRLDQTFFTKMRLTFGGEKIEQKEVLARDSRFVSKLQGYIEEQQLAQYALILVDEQKIRLIMNDPMLFQEGSADLKESGERVIRGFTEIVKDVNNPIIIEGHTDDRPIYTEEFESNWQLSMARAYSVLEYMLEATKISPKNLSIKAYGPNKPLVPNTSPKNRAKNRRVELNIVRVSKAQK